MFVRVFNAFSGSETLSVVLTTGNGESTACTKNEFESGDLSFVDISNRSTITIGRYDNNNYDIMSGRIMIINLCLHMYTATGISSMLTMAVLLTMI